MMNQALYRCDVCNTDTNSNVSYRQHIAGAAHKKAVKIRGYVEKKVLVCDFCNMAFDSQAIYNQHVATQEHKAAAMKAFSQQGINYTPPEEKTDPPNILTGRPLITMSPTVSLHNSTSQQLKYEANDVHQMYDPPTNHAELLAHTKNNEYKFNGQNGHCFICNVTLSSPLNALQHLQGSKHQKARRYSQVDKEHNVRFPPLPRDPEDPKTHYEETIRNKELPRGTFIKVNQKEREKVPIRFRTDLGPGGGGYPALYDEFEFSPIGNMGECKLCNVLFNGADHAASHLFGTKHQKKVRNLEVEMGDAVFDLNGQHRYIGNQNPSNALNIGRNEIYEFNGMTGKCFVCKEDLNYWTHAKQHLTSDSHIRQVKLNYGSNHNDVPLAPYEMYDEDTGYCNVCNCNLQSKIQAAQHLQGSKHAKAVIIWKEEKQMIANLNQGRPVVQHLQGSKHAKAVGIWKDEKQMIANLNQGRPVMMINTDRSPQFNLDPSQAIQQPIQSPSEPMNNPLPPCKGNEYTFNTAYNTGRCNVCAIDLTSFQHAYQHLTGKPHSKATLNKHNLQHLPGRPQQNVKYNHMGPNTNPLNPELTCKVCSITVTGPENMRQHMNCAKHRKKAGLPSLQNESELTLTPKQSQPIMKVIKGQGFTDIDEEISGCVSFTGTPANEEFIPCHICGCTMRTREQEELHLNSSQHKKAEQRLGMCGVMDTKDYTSIPLDLRDGVKSEDSSILFHSSGPNAMNFNNPSMDYTNLLQQTDSEVKGYNMEETRLKQPLGCDELHLNSVELDTKEKYMDTYFKSIEPLSVSVQKNMKNAANDQTKDSQSPDLQQPEVEITTLLPRLPKQSSDSATSIDEMQEMTRNSGSGLMRNSGIQANRNLHSVPNNSLSMQMSALNLKQESMPNVSPLSQASPASVSRNILTQLNSPTNNIPNARSPLRNQAGNIFPCEICNILCNTQKALNDHLQGRGHMAKITSTSIAPMRPHPEVVKFSRDSYIKGNFNLTHTEPRTYQCELLSKVMRQEDGDKICFLPTG